MEIKINDLAWFGGIGYKISIALTENESRNPFEETFRNMADETKTKGYDLMRCRFEGINPPRTYLFQGPIRDKDLFRCVTATVD